MRLVNSRDLLLLWTQGTLTRLNVTHTHRPHARSRTALVYCRSSLETLIEDEGIAYVEAEQVMQINQACTNQPSATWVRVCH